MALQSIKDWWSGQTLLRTDSNLLGSGSFGSVYKTMHNGEEVAVKIIDTHSIQEYADSKYHDVHQNEVIPYMRKLDHENIIKIYDCKWEGHEMFIKMQLCQGNFHSFCNGAVQMGDEVACKMLSQAANGLNHLHLNNVIHRDIKPNNFLILLDDSNNPIVKVADFSFAKYLGKQQGSTMSTVRGNREWLAPELVDYHGREVDNTRFKRSIDVFAFGLVVLYAIVNTEGKKFFYKRSFGADVKNNIDIFQRFEGYWRTTNLKDNFLPLLKRMLAKESDDRPKMEEVATEIASFK